MKRYMHPKVHSSAGYNNQDMEAAQAPHRKLIKNMYACLSHTHTHTEEYYSAIIKNGVLALVTTRMDLRLLCLVK